MNARPWWGMAAGLVAGVLAGWRPAAGAWHEAGFSHRKTIQLTAVSLKDPLAAVIEQGLALNFTIPLKQREEGEIDASLLRVYLDGNVRPDGADIRVTTLAGQALPHKVLYCDPAGYTLVMHKAPNPKARYYLYYGNPNARPVEAAWEPKRGLFLKTSEAPAGMPRDLVQMKALHGKSPEVYGVQYNLWIFNHYNPMGPVEHYLCHYFGWLRCPETGEYEFGTTSDGPSFFLVDGKLVASQISGTASREIRHTGKLHLTKGVYPVEYFGGGPFGPYRVAAAWRRPGDKQVDVIRYEYFPKVYTSEVVETEKHGARIACDFDQKMVDSMPLDDGQITAYQFKNKTSNRSGERVPMKYLWDFGDGTTSTEAEPEHIFFKVGPYTIRLTATDPSGATDTISRRVVIEDFNTVDHEKQHAIGALIQGALHLEHHHSRLYLQIPPEEVEKLGRRYMKTVDQYDPMKVVADALWGMVRLYKRMQANDRLLACSEAFLSRFSRDNPKLAATCRLFLADTYFHERHQPDKAWDLYEQVLQSAGATAVQQKIARIRLADILLGRQKRDEALSHLKEAARLEDPDVNYKAPEFRINAYETQVEDCINRQLVDEGFEVLARWERNFPLELMRGRLLLMRGQLRLVQKRYEQAIDDFQKVPYANPHSPDIPEAYYRMGEACLALKKPREAQEAFRKVVSDFPRSPFAAFAKAGLFKAKEAL